MKSILVIEDDPGQRMALVEFLEIQQKGKAFNVYSAESGEIALTVIRDRSLDLIISDLMLPDMTGIEIVQQVRNGKLEIPYLILTGQPTIETAVEAMRSGASDYLMKPVDLNLLLIKVNQLLENRSLKEENRQLRARIKDRFQKNRIIGNSPLLQEVMERVEQVAGADVTVLIEGESGTGKELFANLIHENSPRSHGPFIKVNCGALAKSILESELFGSVKGAYTGSDRDRPGFFEAAHGGTIFLDEIGELDLESQVRLLRVIEEREVVRVGSTKPIKIDVRIISATNRSLATEVEEEKFREDLYYRLAVIKFGLPSLRERREDIPLLFNHFVTEFNEKYGKSVTHMSDDLKSFMENYDWPGNIRQFRNVLEGMVVLARDYILDRSDLPPDLSKAPSRSTGKVQDNIIPGIRMEEYEKAIISRNLAYTGGNREKTANLLGISERTLYRKIKEFGLEMEGRKSN